MSDVVKGLKKLRSGTGKRKPEWDRPNRKAAARAAVREKAFEQAQAKASNAREKEMMNKPGSMNRRNQG